MASIGGAGWERDYSRNTELTLGRYVRAAAVVVLGVGAVTAYLFVVPGAATAETVDRLVPILLFLTTISIVVNLSAHAGLFRWIAAHAARGAAGHDLRLLLLVVGLSIVATAFLSLDTTAVLVTPLVLALAVRSGIDPMPLAFTVVWIANIGSLFLPVSNLTNLLAVETGTFASTGAFLRAAVVPATAGVVVTILFALLVFGRRLTGARRSVVGPNRPADVRQEFHVMGEQAPELASGAWLEGSPSPHPLLPLSGVVLAILLPLLTTSIPFWWSTSVAAAVLLTAFLIVDRVPVRVTLVPWSALALAAGLVFAVQLVHTLGAEDRVHALLGTSGEDPATLFALAGASALTSNLINNIPAYLLFEPAAESGRALIALLIGSNAGPIITPWASLATLLWADQLRRAGLRVPWRRYAMLGTALVVPAVGVPTALLAFGPG